MRAMAWNCRGVGSTLTVSQIKEICKLHSPDLFFLSETKNPTSLLEKLINRLGFDKLITVDPLGLSGGLALFWKSDIDVVSVVTTPLTIEACIKVPLQNTYWWFIGVYASPFPAERKEQWKFLLDRSSLWGENFILAGDFNDIISNHEKSGGKSRSDSSFDDFKGFITSCGLVDLGFVGPFWTWCRHRVGENPILERLDRVLASPGWYSIFGNAVVRHVYMASSDHCLLDLNCYPNNQARRKKFFFDDRWVNKPGFTNVVKTGWSCRVIGTPLYRIVCKIKEVRKRLNIWKRSSMPNFATKISQLKNQLKDGIDLNLSVSHLKNLKLDLKYAYAEEEKYWKTVSRVKWLKEGDKNTKFFHSIANGKKRKKYIFGLYNPTTKSWSNSPSEIALEFQNYYTNIFRTQEVHPQVLQDNFDLEPVITSDMNIELLKPATEREVRSAIFQMHSSSAPGPDGMSPGFYKSCFSIIKSDLVAAINNFLLRGKLPKEINHTCIALIPKVSHPSEVSHFRPISLCNVSYKIIAKILANRLKKVLPRCIDDYQNAFVSNRFLLDSYIIAHESLHYMLNKRRGKDAYMAVKLDVSKAFDRIEWSFLFFVMHKLGFSPRWIALIKECITTVSFSFIINNDRVGFLIPERGIRQGDPLSPYLFIICAQGLSHLLNKANLNGDIPGVKIAKASPSVNHLFFADDSLLLTKANACYAAKLQHILNLYEQVSGQSINFQKSAIFFSKNTAVDIKNDVFTNLNGLQEVHHTKYLGLPLVIGRQKKQIFSYVIDRCKCKLNSWKYKFLSQGGKAVLLSSSLFAIPNLTMSCIKLPKGVINKLHSLMAKFWWSSSGKVNSGYHWVKWADLCLPRGRGGLGFRNLEAANMVALAKTLWRIYNHPDLLVSRILKGKYFNKSSIFECKVPSSASFVWKSLMSAQKFLASSTCFSVGNGESTRVWEDPWIFGNPHFKPITPVQNSNQNIHVSDLIEDHSWNLTKLKEIFWEVDTHQILKIPLSTSNVPDRRYCTFSKNGSFVTKAAYDYFLTSYRPSSHTSSSSFFNDKFWKMLWALSLPSKLKNFLWKCLKSILPVADILHKRFGIGNPICTACGESMETIDHLFIYCPFAQYVWKIAGISWDSLSAPESSIHTWWENISASSDFWNLSNRVILSCFVLWYIWKARCNRVFGSTVWGFSDTALYAIEAGNEFIQAIQLERNQNNAFSCSPDLQHNSLPQDAMKTFVDAAWKSSSCFAGFGAAVFHPNGSILEAWTSPKMICPSSFAAEAEALRWCLQRGISLGLSKMVCFSDNANLVSCCSSVEATPIESKVILEDIIKLISSFTFCKIMHVRREDNKIAHHLAALSFSRDFGISFKHSIPAWVCNS